jgi:hypothetical protein
MLFLKSHGIAVRSVSNTSNANLKTAFVYLQDSDNKYTSVLIENLQNSLTSIANKLPEIVPQSELYAELSNLYIRQTDYTKDYLGFVVVRSLDDNFDVLRRLGESIGMKLSEDHSQLFSSIQFKSFSQSNEEKPARTQRLKVYNKWAHLVLCSSFKAKLSIGTTNSSKGQMHPLEQDITFFGERPLSYRAFFLLQLCRVIEE